MKKRTKLAMVTFVMSMTMAGISSCSTKDGVVAASDANTNKEHTVGGFLHIPADVLQKVGDIYGHSSTGPQTVTTVHQLAILTSICATHPGNGPISVTPACLNGEEVTLITLGGTEDVVGQATTMEESKLAALGKGNDYLAALCQLFKDGQIPKEKPVLISGISLGGMVAQQMLGQEEILKDFNLKAVITFGSPLTLPLDRKGVKVVRFADVNDRVPELGELLLRNGLVTGDFLHRKRLNRKLAVLDTHELISATSKYREIIETHALSYIEDECWSHTDFLGNKDKSNVLELKEPMKFFHAPKQ